MIIGRFGNLDAGSPVRQSFDMNVLLRELCECTEESELEKIIEALEAVSDGYWEQLDSPPKYRFDDPGYFSGVLFGHVEALKILAAGFPAAPETGVEVDLVIVDRRLEIEIDVPDRQPAAPSPKLIEDLREPRSKRPRATKREIEGIAERAVALREAEGLSASQIAARLGVSEGAMRGQLQRRGINLVAVRPSAWKENRARDKLDEDAIVARAVEIKRANPGLGNRQVAEAVGVKPGTLSGFLHRAGVRLALVGLPEEGPSSKPRTPVPDEVKASNPRPRPAEPDPQGPRPSAASRAPSDCNGFAPRPRYRHEEEMRGIVDRAPPDEPHVAVLDPSAAPIRYVLVGAGGDAERTLKLAREWVQTVVRAGARPPGEYGFKLPGRGVQTMEFEP